MTSLVRSINEVANITDPFPTSADRNGLRHFTGDRTSPLRTCSSCEQSIHSKHGADVALDQRTSAAGSIAN